MNMVIFSTCRYIYVIQRTHSVHDRTVTMVCQVSDSNNVGAGNSRPTEFVFFSRKSCLITENSFKELWSFRRNILYWISKTISWVSWTTAASSVRTSKFLKATLGKRLRFVFNFCRHQNLYEMRFLDASTHLYARVCPSVGPSVQSNEYGETHDFEFCGWGDIEVRGCRSLVTMKGRNASDGWRDQTCLTDAILFLSSPFFRALVQSKFDAGDNLLVTVLSAMGEELAVGVKMST